MDVNPPLPTLTLRPATPADAPAVARLAQLDSAPVPTGALLIAIVDERPVAALALDGGAVVADPFVRTLEVVGMLRDRAARLEVAGAGGGRPGRRWRRVAPAARPRRSRNAFTA